MCVRVAVLLLLPSGRSRLPSAAVSSDPPRSLRTAHFRTQERKGVPEVIEILGPFEDKSVFDPYNATYWMVTVDGVTRNVMQSWGGPGFEVTYQEANGCGQGYMPWDQSTWEEHFRELHRKECTNSASGGSA